MEKLKQELKKENSLLQIKCDLIIDKMARAHKLEHIALKKKTFCREEKYEERAYQTHVTTQRNL